MKTSELTGTLLDYWTAKACGMTVRLMTMGELQKELEERVRSLHWSLTILPADSRERAVAVAAFEITAAAHLNIRKIVCDGDFFAVCNDRIFKPDLEKIIEAGSISIIKGDAGKNKEPWRACANGMDPYDEIEPESDDDCGYYGISPLEAVQRAYVGHKIGKEVPDEIPK